VRKLPDIPPDQSETEVSCLSDPSEVVSDLTVTLSNVNQNVRYSPGLEARLLNGESEQCIKSELEMCNQARGFHRGVRKFIAKIQMTYFQANLNSKSSDIRQTSQYMSDIPIQT
jgi:hypothetical protein